ncbi:MAG: SURF1 family protein [Alphaproteobacteria bacterium]
MNIKNFKFLPLPLAPSLMAFPAILLLFSLGTWQLLRLDEKTTYLDRLYERMELMPVPLPQLDQLSLEAWEFRPVSAVGEFIHEQEIHIMNRALNGKEGLNIVTPFKLAPPYDQTILINRGFVPFDKKEIADRPLSATAGTVNLSGLLRYDRGQPTLRKLLLPEAELDNNLWYALDIEKINARLGHQFPLYYIMDDNTEIPGGHPLGKQWKINVQNDHLEYAITWFSLGFALIGIFALFVYQWRKTLGRTTPEKTTPGRTTFV